MKQPEGLIAVSPGQRPVEGESRRKIVRGKATDKVLEILSDEIGLILINE
ncbi:hypothetical protein [Mangrovibacterium diazotrophicum]|nr:hypothetical protein [Mangrovibacterium diazotrophicum]